MTQRIYCGPNLIRFGLFTYQVFIGEDYAPNVQDALSYIPEIKHLFCDVADLDSFRAKINTQGTAEHVFYQTIERKSKEVK